MANSITRNSLITEAERRGWRTEIIGPNAHFCKVTLPDGRWELFTGSRPMRSSANGLAISKYKNLTMDFLTAFGYRLPKLLCTDNETDAITFMNQVGTVVIKPADGQRSQGVTVDIDSAEKVGPALQYALQHSANGKVVVQQQLEGNLYRLFVLNGELVAASHRRAAGVVGDGQHSIQELIEALNTDSRRGNGQDTPLKKVHLEDVEQYLGREALQRIPATDEHVRLTAIESVSAGGDSVNVTAAVHPTWSAVAIEVAVAAGLFVCGFDVLCADISQPVPDILPLLELNSSPGFKLHEHPTGGGEPIYLAPMLLDALFSK